MKRSLLVTVVILAVFGFAGQALAASAIVRLGEALYKDPNLSAGQDQSCMTCHHPLAGFADTSNHVDPLNSPNSDGSDPTLFGGRNAPSAAYAGFSPPLDCVEDEEGGTFCTGGMFWDGRATGLASTDTEGIQVSVPWPNGTATNTGPTFDPLADQAKGPFQNLVEMALMPDEVIAAVLASNYTKLFKQAFGYKVATEVVNNAPGVYNDIAIAIAAFERSAELNKFSSKFDQFAKEQAKKRIDVSTIALDNGVVVDGSRKLVKSKVFMQEELEGLALFNMPNDNDGILDPGEGGNCAACHPTGPITDPTDSLGKTLFTDFSYDNLGVPVNPAIAVLAGVQDLDLGLKATLVGLNLFPGLTREGTEGLFKVPTLRNVALTAPYAHNGFFPTLKSIVHFYNSRDVEDLGVAEVPGTVNDVELGDLGLLPAHEEKIVLFLETLTDR